MKASLRPHFPLWLLPVAFVAIMMAFCACSKNNSKTPLSLVPGLSPQMIEHLTTGDDSTLTAYCREIGWWRVTNAFWDISGWLGETSLDLYEANVDTLDTYLFRLGKVLEDEYHYSKSSKDLRLFQTLSHEARREVLAKRREWSRVQNDETMSLEEKIEYQFEGMKFFEKYDDPYGEGLCHMTLATLYTDIGREADADREWRIAYDLQSEAGNSRLVCQILGVMGSRHAQAGDIDSMIVCYEKALKIATECRIPGQTARIYSFYASHYYREGRLALAHAMYHEAIEWCREFKGGHSEIRYILAAMSYYERLGCWDICERNLARARLLEKKYNDELLDVQKLRLDRFEARVAMARGDVKKADAIYKRIKQPVDDLRHRLDLIEMLFNWSRGLVENDRAADALPIIDEGYRRSIAEFTPEWTPRFALLRAEALFETGELGTARVSIADSDSLASRDVRYFVTEWMRRDALLGQVELAAGDREAALAVLEGGFSRLRESLEAMDPSVHSYLWLGEGEGLRTLAHDLFADEPKMGYGVEMLWRDLHRDIGARSTMKPGRGGDVEKSEIKPRPLIQELEKISTAVMARVAKGNAIHAVYRLQGDEVWRWTVTRGGIRRDVLNTSPAELKVLTTETYDRLSRKADGKAVSVRLLEDLRKLGRTLLPEEVLTAAVEMPRPTFLVTPDCCLNQIPFDAFDTAEDGPYSPLLLTSDVAYLRFAEPAIESPPVSNGVIAVNPRPSDELQKRFPFQQELEQAVEEGRAMAALDPAAAYFEGDMATKQRLQQRWGEASYIYLATHTLRDPAVPYLVLIPMAADSNDAGPDAGYLDVFDIRSADLSACRVVILSGCSSGAPYMALGRHGPSLGDAFLDAGAGAVIQTFWDVKDDDARVLMTSFIKLWKGTCLNEVKTLSEARRRSMISSEGVRNPSSWASYSIKLGRL